jgi:hypothetical protein
MGFAVKTIIALGLTVGAIWFWVGDDQAAGLEFVLDLEPYVEDLDYRGKPGPSLEPQETKCWVIADGELIDREQAECIVKHLIKTEQQVGYPNVYRISPYSAGSPRSVIVLVSQNTTRGTDLFLGTFDSPGCEPTILWRDIGFRVPHAPHFQTLPIENRSGNLALAFVATDARGGNQLTVVSSDGTVRFDGLELLEYRIARNGQESAIVAKTVERIGRADCPDGRDGPACAEVLVTPRLITAEHSMAGESSRTVAMSGMAGYQPLTPLPRVDLEYQKLEAAFFEER